MFYEHYPGRDLSNYKLKFSQNFLNNVQIAEQAVKFLDLEVNDLVIEIGPGKGFITEILLKNLKPSCRVIAVEKDIRLVNYLSSKFSDQIENGVLKVVSEDILNYELPVSGRFKVIGNIPFGVSADIVRKLLNSYSQPLITTLIVQKEFALRLKGNESGKQETFFSLQFKPWFEINDSIGIDRTKFNPQPKVDSELIKIVKHKSTYVNMMNKEQYLDFIAFAFSGGGKNLRSVLKKVFTWKQFKFMSQKYRIDFSSKVTNLTFESWIKLFESFIYYVPNDKKKMVKDSYMNLIEKQSNLIKKNRTRLD